MISSGKDGKSDCGDGRLSMNERTSLSEEETFGGCSVLLPSFELGLEPLNSKVEGTVVGASACRSKLDVVSESQTSASKVPSE